MVETLTCVHESYVQGSGKSPYTVRFYADGSTYCTCPSWKNKKEPATRRSCKHTAKVFPQVKSLLAQYVPSNDEDMGLC